MGLKNPKQIGVRLIYGRKISNQNWLGGREYIE